jgi:hypothetical protein
MSTKTLNNIDVLGSSLNSARPVRSRTYSITPRMMSTSSDVPNDSAADVEIFLEGENPLGCIRGVMWVMAFNAAVFVLGFTIWQSCKYLW